MRRSLRRRSRAAQALGVTPGQVLANPLPRYDMDFPGCGCSSGVEHDLAKVGVEGSNPFARSKFQIRFNRLPPGGPEEGLVHWRETGAKPIEQKIDGADGVDQIGRIERRVEL